MAKRLRTPSINFSHSLDRHRNTRPVLLVCRPFLRVHLQPSDDEASEILEEPSQVRNPNQSTLFPRHDTLDLASLPSRSDGLFETL